MAYFLNLFSMETWNAAGSDVSGFSRHQRTQAQRSLKAEDIFLCYLVGLGRCGPASLLRTNYDRVLPICVASEAKVIVYTLPIVVTEAKSAI